MSNLQYAIHLYGDLEYLGGRRNYAEAARIIQSAARDALPEELVDVEHTRSIVTLSFRSNRQGLRNTLDQALQRAFEDAGTGGHYGRIQMKKPLIGCPERSRRAYNLLDHGEDLEAEVKDGKLVIEGD